MQQMFISKYCVKEVTSEDKEIYSARKNNVFQNTEFSSQCQQ